MVAVAMVVRSGNSGGGDGGRSDVWWEMVMARAADRGGWWG